LGIDYTSVELGEVE